MTITATKIKPTIDVEITGRSGHEFVESRVADGCQAALAESGGVVCWEAYFQNSIN